MKHSDILAKAENGIDPKDTLNGKEYDLGKYGIIEMRIIVPLPKI